MFIIFQILKRAGDGVHSRSKFCLDLFSSIQNWTLRHCACLGLNMSIVNPGGLPRYEDIEANTRKLAEEVILNKSDDGTLPVKDVQSQRDSCSAFPMFTIIS